MPKEQEEARWPALIALLAVGGLYLSLPSFLTIGPRWLPLAIMGALAVPSMITDATDHRLSRRLGVVQSSVVTFFLLASLVLLISGLPERKETPEALLGSAAAIWLTNILVFALWYWRFDAGGPFRRRQTLGHHCGDFLFPQMTMSPEVKEQLRQKNWAPNFIDYLFLAFNTSTALSPADTGVLTRWAKLLSMLQACISVTIIVLLVARGVNTL